MTHRFRPASAWTVLARSPGRGAVGLAAVLAGLAGPAVASDPAAWTELQQADAAHGRRLIAQHKCSDCHARRVGGDGSAIYRPSGRIGRPAALLAMVELCNTELNLQLFPDDVAAIAAALNQAHYRFTPPAKP
jgi:hypothetical protein